MKEITFWAHIAEDGHGAEIIEKLREIMSCFRNREDFEVIIIQASNLNMNEVADFEKEYTDNVVLVECEISENESAQEVMLGYADGMCFLEVDGKTSFDERTLDKLLYDANICSEDSYKYIRNKYTCMLCGRTTERVLFDKQRNILPATIVQKYHPDMRPLKFSCVHNGKTTTINFENTSSYEKTQVVLEDYSKKLGEGDFGTFVFERC